VEYEELVKAKVELDWTVVCSDDDLFLDDGLAVDV
jgi:hypothetical protein